MIKLLFGLSLIPILVAIAAAGSVKPKIVSTVEGVAAPPTVTALMSCASICVDDV